MAVKIILLFLLVTLFCSTLGTSQDLDTVIKELAQKIADAQIVKPSGKQDFYKKQVGVYPCNIRLNFNGDASSALLRDNVGVFDNNAFVTLWVSTILLEVEQFFNIGPQPSRDQLYRSIEAVSTYHDHNRPQEDGVLVFWPQKLNSSTGLYYCDPENLEPISERMDDVLHFLHKLLSDIGLEKFWEETLRSITELMDSSMKAYHIPPDFDDTFVNLGFGFLLSNRSASDSLYPLWWKSNSNNIEALKALKMFAYRPFSNDTNSNLIDSRTFFYLRDYLYEIQQENRLPAVFATTWAQNLEGDRAAYYDVMMPFNANNVDLTVSTNVIYGLTASVLMENGSNGTAASAWFDSEVQTIYENTTDLLTWCLERNFSGRPDLALTYYPSVFNFYWFTARTLNILQSHFNAHGHLPYSVMDKVMSRLSDALRGNATYTLLKKAITDEDGLVYFEDFLGMDDKDIFGKSVNHAEDRVCSTAVAVNALLYTWTANHRLDPSTPVAVNNTVVKACKWLLKNSLSGKYKNFNVLFSGSVKLAAELPFYYPTKDLKFVNGTAVPPGTPPGPDVVIGVRGIIPQDEYDQLLKKEYYGQHTPMDFHGYNGANSWPFWSSEPFTHSSVMLALTQYKAYYL